MSRGIRQILQQNPRVTIIVVAALVVVSVAVIAIEWRESGKAPLYTYPDKAFYTVDNGATLFADSSNKIPPFDHEGHQAFLAAVFTADGGRHQWVGYLRKYSDEAKAAVEQGRPSGQGNTLVRRPGDSQWVSETSDEGGTIQNVKPPQGMGDGPVTSVRP